MYDEYVERKKCQKWITNCWIFAIIWLRIFAVHGINANILPDENGPLSEVQTAVGFEVSLPCDLIPASAVLIQDKVTLVIWYREGNLKPIYTFDARGKPMQQAVHWADHDVFTTKAHFYYDTNPPSLRIQAIKREDAGLYRCRVDFQKSPTRNLRINLTVLVPPTQLIILDSHGAAKKGHSSSIGPYREGASINITCVSSGGIPTPRVSWWKEHALLDDSFQTLPDGAVKNVLHLPKLNRRDLSTVYTCQASNGHVVPPLSSNVKLEMMLSPLYVRLQGLNHALVSGVRKQVSCSSAGARPPPQIVWSKGGIIMSGASQTTSSDGNVTISELVFLPVPEDNGKLVTCSVTSDSTVAGDTSVFLKDSRILDVKHAPLVSLSLGAPLDPHNLMKGSDVYLECDIKANPAAKRVEWFQNDKQLYSSSRGIIIANQTLVLQRITKSTHGQYMCRATNLQGTVGSNEVYLDVKYPPTCTAESHVIRAAIKQVVNISCDIDSNPMQNLTYTWTFNNTLENTIDLNTYDSGSFLDDVQPYTETLLSNMIAATPSPQNTRFHDALTLTPAKLTSSAHIFRYKVDSFQHFGTVTCNAQNALGQSGPCLYHIMAAEIPDPVRNCTVSNVTAYSVHIACEPGRDGGIQQYFSVDVVDADSNVAVYNASYKSASFVLKRLPSDCELLIKVTAYNAQGSSHAAFHVRTSTLTEPLLRTASSTAVLVQLTPVLGALIGVVATLFLVAVCIVIFVKFRCKKNNGGTTCADKAAGCTEPDKGSTEPLSRNMGSHSSIDENNPDVVPQETSDGEYTAEEKAFDRLTTGGLYTHRIHYTPHFGSTPPPPPSLSPTSAYSANSLIMPAKPYNEQLCLTTNPAFALYNSPQRRPPLYPPSPMLHTTVGGGGGGDTNAANIYTRIPSRPFSPYDNRLTPSLASAAYSSNGAVTMPLLMQQQQHQQHFHHHGVVTPTYTDDCS